MHGIGPLLYIGYALVRVVFNTNWSLGFPVIHINSLVLFPWMQNSVQLHIFPALILDTILSGTVAPRGSSSEQSEAIGGGF